MEYIDDNSDTPRRQFIASQACTTCRSRKTKCNEERPKCGLCKRLDVACFYQEPKPTKKDKTLQDILAKLEALQFKVDQLRRLNIVGKAPGKELILSSNTPGSEDSSLAASSSRPSFARSMPPTFEVPYRSSAEIHRLLSLPAIEKLISNDLGDFNPRKDVYPTSEIWLDHISKDLAKPIVAAERINIAIVDTPYFLSPNPLGPTGPYLLSSGTVDELVTAFFSSFNYHYPLLDREHFNVVVLPKVKSENFDEELEESSLALLVLALGTIAQQGTIGEDVLEYPESQPTGVKGGSVKSPPGIVYLHEALRRLGLLMSSCSLPMVQCHILVAIYYSACSRNLEYWRLIEKSCSLLLSLHKTFQLWGPFEAEMYSRAYWTCVLLESGPTGELGVSSTGIDKLKDSVKLPNFLCWTRSGLQQPIEDELFKAKHFLAMIGLRDVLSSVNLELRFTRSVINGEFQVPPRPVMKELSKQLADWRESLNISGLNWSNDEKLGLGSFLFNSTSAELRFNGAPFQMIHPNVILSASLQTRYKYVLYMIHRPYIYQLLQSPYLLQPEDLQECRIAFHACTFWPLLLEDFQQYKRLLPHLYEYSHSFFSILIILYVCRLPTINVSHQILDSDELNGPIERTVGAMLRWLRDMKVVHPVAAWCWTRVRALYREHPIVEEHERGA